MPKRTRRQKLLADQRHDQLHLAPTFSFQAQQTQEKRSEDVSELTAIRSDLIKTIILAIIAIGVELVLFVERR